MCRSMRRSAAKRPQSVDGYRLQDLDCADTVHLRLRTTGEESGSQNVLLLSWMMLMWHFFQRLNLLVGRFRSSICVTRLKVALRPRSSCFQSSPPSVCGMLSFRSLLMSLCFRTGNASLWHRLPAYLFWCGSSWTRGQRAGVARHCSPGV